MASANTSNVTYADCKELAGLQPAVEVATAAVPPSMPPTSTASRDFSAAIIEPLDVGVGGPPLLLLHPVQEVIRMLLPQSLSLTQSLFGPTLSMPKPVLLQPIQSLPPAKARVAVPQLMLQMLQNPQLCPMVPLRVNQAQSRIHQLSPLTPLPQPLLQLLYSSST